MNKRKFSLLILIFGILLIILGISIFIYQEITTNKKNQKQLENTITEKHEIFRNKVELFNEVRSKYYIEVNDNLYPESVESEYENWIVILDDYTAKVDEVEEESKYLKQNCIDKVYSNKEIMSKCDAFVIAYETVINYYTKDIISFNENIDTYYRQNTIDDKESKIKNYSSKYNYVDIDSDGNFIGKD